MENLRTGLDLAQLSGQSVIWAWHTLLACGRLERASYPHLEGRTKYIGRNGNEQKQPKTI